MYVERVRAVSFRCYDRLDAGLHPGLTAVVGRNGSGKTSLVEALHFGCVGYSPRTSHEARCVRAGADFLRVEIEGVAVGEALRTAVGFRPGEPKRVSADGASLASVEGLARRWACLVFTPDHLALVKRAPAVRRAYLDRALGRLLPTYARTAADYGRVLAHRGALLRRVRAGTVAAGALDPWDEQLAVAGPSSSGRARAGRASRAAVPCPGGAARRGRRRRRCCAT
jgi:DNA replication and repair protein RecF